MRGAARREIAGFRDCASPAPPLLTRLFSYMRGWDTTLRRRDDVRKASRYLLIAGGSGMNIPYPPPDVHTMPVFMFLSLRQPTEQAHFLSEAIPSLPNPTPPFTPTQQDLTRPNKTRLLQPNSTHVFSARHGQLHVPEECVLPDRLPCCSRLLLFIELPSHRRRRPRRGNPVVVCGPFRACKPRQTHRPNKRQRHLVFDARAHEYIYIYIYICCIYV